MATKRKRYRAEEIIGKLREAEVGLAQGQSVGQVARRLWVSEQTYYRWRREYDGMKVDQAKRLKELERENAQPEEDRRRPGARQRDAPKALPGKRLSPAKRRRAVTLMREQFTVSERRACTIVGQARATERYVPRASADARYSRRRSSSRTGGSSTTRGVRTAAWAGSPRLPTPGAGRRINCLDSRKQWTRAGGPARLTGAIVARARDVAMTGSLRSC